MKTVKKTRAFYKDPVTGGFKSMNVIGEKTSEEIIAEIEEKGEKTLKSIPDDYTEVTEKVEQLESETEKNIGVQKLSGYFNLAKLSNATIYKGKRIAQYDTTNYEPVLVDDELYTTVIMPIDVQHGNYNMIIGENHPSSGIAMMRYKTNVGAAVIGYNQVENLNTDNWDAKYDSNNHVLSYLTDTILGASSVDMYAFCFYNTEPIVYASNLQTLDSGVFRLLKIIGAEQLTDDIRQCIDNVIGICDIDICLPDTIYSVVGHEHNINFWNIVKCSNINNYVIRVSGANYGSGIKNLGDCVRMKPIEPKTQVLTFKIYHNEALILEKTTTIKMIDDTIPTNIKAMFIGDSMVANGYSVAELKNMLGDNITFYGTIQGGQTDANDVWQTVYHEGRSSWDSNDYLTLAEKNGVTNAFFNSEKSAFDFSYYVGNNPSFSDVTDVIVQLGNNDATHMTKEEYLSNMQFMVDSIREYNASINVYVCIPSPVVNDGYAYGTRNYVDIHYEKDKIFEHGKYLLENITNATIIPVYQNLDCYNDFPKTTVQRSARNPETYEVCNDNVHPSKYGFYKFADTFYCSILAKYNS